jgi:hypothetical protein
MIYENSKHNRTFPTVDASKNPRTSKLDDSQSESSTS